MYYYFIFIFIFQVVCILNSKFWKFKYLPAQELEKKSTSQSLSKGYKMETIFENWSKLDLT